MNALENFIYFEQVKNNFNLYSKEKYKDVFKMDIKKDFIPENQCSFKLPYFLIPQNSEYFEFDEEYYDFLLDNVFQIIDGKLYYPFFIHPTSEEIFTKWINDKYKFVTSEDSIFFATPTSSYRTLSVINSKTEMQFFAKVSIFGNVANGARQIDWKSANGQFFFSKCTYKAAATIDNFDVFKDICAIGLDGEREIEFSRKYLITFGPNTFKVFGNIIRVFPKSSDFNNKIISVASFTSLRDGNCYLKEAFYKSNKNINDFLFFDIYKSIVSPFLNLFVFHGISVEMHCQNTLIELSPDNKITGKIFYRDFDITCLDRARFPFLHYEDWKIYCKNRQDRLSLFSNVCAREDIGTNFFSHFLTNLIEPCLRCAVKLNLLTNKEKIKLYRHIYKDLQSCFVALIPKANRNFYKKDEWIYFQKWFNEIDFSEIPVRLEKIKEFSSKDFMEIFVNSPELTTTDLYKFSDDLIISFSGDTMKSMFQRISDDE